MGHFIEHLPDGNFTVSHGGQGSGIMTHFQSLPEAGEGIVISQEGGKMTDYKIREIRPTEINLMKVFLYEAIFQRDHENLLPRDIINEPELKIYIDDFGKRGDYCHVADVGGVVVGAVWTRILAGKIKGFGNIDEHTPEFAISLYKEYRNMGMGTALMHSMLQLLKDQGFKRTSLSVQKDNYAVEMYKKVGFKIFKELKEDYIMVCDLA